MDHISIIGVPLFHIAAVACLFLPDIFPSPPCLPPSVIAVVALLIMFGMSYLTTTKEIMNRFHILSFVLHATTINIEGLITGNSIRFNGCSKINMDDCNTS